MRKKNISVFIVAVVLILQIIPLAAWGDSIIKEIYYTKEVSETMLTGYHNRFRLSLWTGSESDPGSAEIWSEEKHIEINNGAISTYLGQIVPLDEKLFVRQLWVQVDYKEFSGGYIPIGRREKLEVVPYALYSIRSSKGQGVNSITLGKGLIGTGRTGDVAIDLNFGAGEDQVARGRHFHDSRYYTKQYIDALEARIAALEGAATRRPVANAGPDENVKTGSAMTLDGSGSYDPDNRILTYSWTLSSKPAGSNAILSNAQVINPNFIADKSGVYTASLIVNNGKINSLPDLVSITAAFTNTPPVANAGADKNTVAGNGTIIELDGGQSYDADGDALTYSWVLLTKPQGSKATLSDAKAVRPSFSADVEGVYTLSLTVKDGVISSLPDTVLINSYRLIKRFDFLVLDAEYSKQLEKIIMVSTDPLNQLHIYDPVTGQDSNVNLNLAPTSVSVSPDGHFAVVGHNAYISYVNLQTATRIKIIPVTTDVLDIVFAGNGYAYAFPRMDQWESIRCIDLSTGQETSSGGYDIYAGTRAKLHPGGKSIYGADKGLSPSDIEKYDISSGTAKYLYDSPYHGDYSMCGDLWISEDGLRVFTKCGNVFRASENRTTDMTYNGSLAGVNYIQHLDHSSASGKIASIPADTWSETGRDSEVQFFNYEYLTFDKRVSLPYFVIGEKAFKGHGRFVFYNSGGDKLFVIVQADADAGFLYDNGIVIY